MATLEEFSPALPPEGPQERLKKKSTVAMYGL